MVDRVGGNDLTQPLNLLQLCPVENADPFSLECNEPVALKLLQQLDGALGGHCGTWILSPTVFHSLPQSVKIPDVVLTTKKRTPRSRSPLLSWLT